MTTRYRHHTLLRACAATLLLVAFAASCSGDDKAASGNATSGGETTQSSAAAAKCPGEPLKFVTFAALTGGPTGSVDMKTARIGVDAALKEINGTCSLGRPVEVTICDDKFDVNGSLACGREAAENGTLAMISSKCASSARKLSP